MAPDGIAEPVDAAANGAVCLLASVADGSPDEPGFGGLEERLHDGAPWRSPWPEIKTGMPCFVSAA
jgi:hypothetical protein